MCKRVRLTCVFHNNLTSFSFRYSSVMLPYDGFLLLY